jgi:hypothetical protein
MSLELMAGLGFRRGNGESLLSWLRAGPLPLSSWIDKESRHDLNYEFNYCPGCVVREQNRRRYYSQTEWRDPRRAICAVHSFPLLRASAPPKRLTMPHQTPGTRLQLRCLNRWVETWISSSPGSVANRLMLSSTCLQDQVLLLLTEGEGAVRSLALANWRLWLEGWPLPSHPHGTPCYQLSLMPSQTDRLAILAATWRIWGALLRADWGSWPALPMDAEAFCRFQSALHKTWPHLESRLPFVLVPEA